MVTNQNGLTKLNFFKHKKQEIEIKLKLSRMKIVDLGTL